ncbi:MAG: phosphatidylglycerophosphatase A [Holophagaceae bacterium]|nr:phosphatidylglycerophosphatase A [Holophagaceae bacterium]
MKDIPNRPVAYVAPRWAWCIATGLGSGRLRPAPGTWGSLAGCIAWLVLVYLAHPLSPLVFECLLGATVLAIIFVSIISAGLVARQVGKDDPSYVVSDEWAGVWLSLWPVRHHVAIAMGNHHSGNWKLPVFGVVVAFLFFRIFDIWKPWPIKKLEGMPGGWGITLDDVCAGIFAGLALYCTMFFLWHFK